jgi:Ca2+-binding EF-hand superfamily protein
MKGLAFVVAVGLATTAAIASATSSDRAPRFDRLDSNADGKLSRDEAAAHSITAQRFQQLDVNKDGFLSRDELASKRRSFCDPSEAEGQVGKAQSHSSRRTTFSE